MQASVTEFMQMLQADPAGDLDGAQRWQERANCLGVDPDLFFPERGASTREAKAVCRRCEVIDTCLKWAIETGQDAGVWGGLSEDERRALKRRNARAKVRTA